MFGGLIDLTIPSSSPPEDPSRRALHAAIDEAQPERLRKALRHLCGNSKDTARLAEAILLVPRDGSWTKPTSASNEESQGTDESESNSSSDNEAAAAAEGARNTAQGRKRLRPRYATCRNCEEEFDVTQNGSEDCVYHPGKSAGSS